MAPTDEELLELMPEIMRDEFSYAAKVCSDAMGGQVKPGIFRVALNTAALEYAALYSESHHQTRGFMTVDNAHENRKARYLDWLYDQSNRTSEVYTGLYQDRIKALIKRDMEEALGELPTM